jgi:hypothetical protein
MRCGFWRRFIRQYDQLRDSSRNGQTMRGHGHWRALLIGAALTLAYQDNAVAFGDVTANAAPCSVAAGGNASNNTVTCNFGLTPEELKQATRAAVEGATEPLLGRIVDISKRLGVTEEAAKTLLKIVGEQPDVPDERLAEVLTKVANDYKRLQAQVAALNPDNPTARGLVAQAQAAITAGDLGGAHELLREATQAQVAAAQQAHKIREQAQAAEDAQMLGAASSTATEGDVALTERHYTEAADLFDQAARFVPRDHSDAAAGYLARKADALYRQGDGRTTKG